MRKKIYIGAHLHIPLKLLLWNFLQISQLSIRSGAHKLFRRFFGLFFANFDRNFAKIVAPPGDENENYVEHLKELSLVKINAENRVDAIRTT